MKLLKKLLDRIQMKPEKKPVFEGRFLLEVIRDGKVVHSEEGHNVVTNEGKNINLNIAFGSTSKPTWYMGIISTASPNLDPAAADTMTSHSNWVESSNYDESTRPAWGAGTAASQSITNASAVVFTISATDTIRGLFITTNNTKGGTSGTLWSAATFTSVPVVDNDVLRLTYTLTVG